MAIFTSFLGVTLGYLTHIRSYLNLTIAYWAEQKQHFVTFTAIIAKPAISRGFVIVIGYAGLQQQFGLATRTSCQQSVKNSHKQVIKYI